MRKHLLGVLICVALIAAATCAIVATAVANEAEEVSQASESQPTEPAAAEAEPTATEAEPTATESTEPAEEVEPAAAEAEPTDSADSVTTPDYFTITGTAAFSIETNKAWDDTIEYSDDKGESWQTWDGTAIAAPASKTLLFRGTNNTAVTPDGDTWYITTAGTVALSGNIMTLLDWQTVANGEMPTMAPYAFYEMFEFCTALSSVSSNLLPATSLAESCYEAMFHGCKQLGSLPAKLLPATTLAPSCYCLMFYGCTSLTELPEALLPATNLAASCYKNMFGFCTGLTTLPAKLLPATTLQSSCYEAMFSFCFNLTTLPANLLPASILPEKCYAEMFGECSSLKSLPTISHVTSLGKECCLGMFMGCGALEVNDEGFGVAWSTPNVDSPGENWNEHLLSDTRSSIGDRPALNTTYYVGSRILEQPSAANNFTFKLDETGYDQGTKSIQYAWYGFETDVCTDADVQIQGYVTYSDGSWIVDEDEILYPEENLFIIDLKAGETLYVEMSAENPVNPCLEMVCFQPGFYKVYEDSTSIVFQAPYDGEYRFSFYADSCTSDLTVDLSASRRAAAASYQGNQLSSDAPLSTPFICVASLLDEGVDSVATDSAEELLVQEIVSDVVIVSPSEPVSPVIPATGDVRGRILLAAVAVVVVAGVVLLIVALRKRRDL